MPPETTPPGVPRVALLVTCLADLFRPTVAQAALRLLDAAGCTVRVPERQTCCGQPAFNSGDRVDAVAQARFMVEALEAESVDYVVAPSGSCASHIRHQYPILLGDDPAWAGRARELADKTHELLSFLVDRLGWTDVPGRLDAQVTYHDTCSGVRELGVKAQPRALMARVEGLAVTELAAPEECCGFGGTFCVKYPDISGRMAGDKADDVVATGAGMVLGGDMGCLLNIAGMLKRRGSSVQVRHVAEVLAGLTDAAPPIGEGTEAP
ncbi:(Fe-S)-binding protein [Roseospira marina]|uniref:(Fe-S)-binding protein n=1 Tax=Roseospira marina TaxID=140057 RepID=A0A5M6I7W5_9PROT|nr:(Fe-S)-binding protein [Roseospira marina]KAA5604316.1 (Fe-S)-binding protein [Roseospira marina]MBB4315660.1 L-lactate dehydrogenase complex protein LldE [Roseospira marina]MBB5088718.1 L-lactate dehydrogenase complex protein LldE [Roseospira marina]